MSVCPERDMRAAMPDDEFWPYVLGLVDDGSEETGLDLDAVPFNEPCPVCGEPQACAYDTEGRPMIHTMPDEDEP